MTVFYIIDSFPNLSENFILREITALKKLGINIRICSLKKPDGNQVHPDAVPLLGDVIYLENISLSRKVLAVAVNLFRNPALFGILAVSMMRDIKLSFRFMLQRLHGALNAMAIANFAPEKPDHVHAHFAYVATDTARILANIAGCRWSVSAHAWDIFTQPRDMIRRRLETADRIFVCSMHGKKLLESMSLVMEEERIVLMYHGVETGEFETSAVAGQGQIIAVGRLEEKKGFDVLLKACKILAEQNNRTRCIIVGEGPCREKLEGQIRQFGLANVELQGAVGFEKVKLLMAESMLLIHPGRITENGDHDGIPNVLLEAMALGKPVITSSVGGIPELIEDRVNGFLVRPDDPEQLADAIKGLMNDKALAERIGRAAKERIKASFEITETVQPLFKYFLSR